MLALRHQFAAAASIALATLAAPLIGGLATRQSVSTWYREELALPAWNPPSWVFGPVWTVLYIMMGTAAFLVWQRLARHHNRALHTQMKLLLGLYAAQLSLNTLWPVLFFGLQSPGAALVGITLLLAAIIATSWSFWRVRPLASWLLLPYLGWTGFAAALNASIWWMNR